MKRIYLLTVICLVLFTNTIFAQNTSANEILAPGLTLKDKYTINSPKNFYRDYQAVNQDGTVNAVVEIPTGTNAKWEVDPKTGILSWEIRNGKPRVVSYLSYVGNYGMIPRTLSGDNDPLDIIVLGESAPRGSIIKANIIGVLKALDGGEQDDKLIAVRTDSVLGKVTSLKELNEKFPGVASIVEIWFTNYKGPGKMVIQGLADAEEAKQILVDAVKRYK